MYTVEELVQVGGSEWQKAGKHRVYFNHLAGWYGLQTWRYKSGNLSSAELHGERISNNQARKLLSRLVNAKVYYDLTDNQFHGQGIDQDDFRVVIDAIKAAIAEQRQRLAEWLRQQTDRPPDEP